MEHESFNATTMNLIKTLSVIGLIVAASAAPVDSVSIACFYGKKPLKHIIQSSDKLLASIRRTSKEFENVVGMVFA